MQGAEGDKIGHNAFTPKCQQPKIQQKRGQEQTISSSPPKHKKEKEALKKAYIFRFYK